MLLLTSVLFVSPALAATAVVVAGGVQSVNGNAMMLYSVVIIDSPNPAQSYSSDYTINVGQTVAQNVTAWKNKIIAEVGAKGATITTGNIILWGE